MDFDVHFVARLRAEALAAFHGMNDPDKHGVNQVAQGRVGVEAVLSLTLQVFQ